MTDKKKFSAEAVAIILEIERLCNPDFVKKAIVDFLPDFISRDMGTDVSMVYDNTYNHYLPIFKDVAKKHGWDIDDKLMESLLRGLIPTMLSMTLMLNFDTGGYISANDVDEILPKILDAIQEDPVEILEGIKETM